MDKLSEIRLPVEKELAEYTALFRSSLQHSNPVLQVALTHLSSRTGKMMRPVLLFLVARLYGKVTSEILHAAVSLELLHTASLVHDDIVDESDMRSGFAFKAHRELEEDAGEGGIVVVAARVAGEEGMDAKSLRSALAQHAKRLEELGLGHAVLRVAGVVHDAVGELEEPAGVEAARDGARNGARNLLEEGDVRDVVEVYDGIKLARHREIERGRVVRGEHDVLTAHAERLGDHELGGAGAVAAASVVAQDRDERGVGVRLDGEELLEPGIPRKRIENGFRVGADAGLVVEMEWRRELVGNSNELVFRDKWALHASSLGDSAPAGTPQTVSRVFPANPPGERARSAEFGGIAYAWGPCPPARPRIFSSAPLS